MMMSQIVLVLVFVLVLVLVEDVGQVIVSLLANSRVTRLALPCLELPKLEPKVVGVGAETGHGST